MHTIRLFVSSPDDVRVERQRIQLIAERLNGELFGRVQFEIIRWENEFYTAHKSFSEQIPEAAECDIVIAVLWSRLGTKLSDTLPEKFRTPDGKPYLSGTAYEVLTAIAARKNADRPDVYVFRKTETPKIRIDDETERAEADEQWKR